MVKINSVKKRIPYFGLFSRRLRWLKKYKKNIPILEAYWKRWNFIYWKGSKTISDIEVLPCGEDGCICVEDLKLPYVSGYAVTTFWIEFPDNLLPYIAKCEKIQMLGEEIDLDLFYNEGPYEINGAVIEDGDVVIDCGANMGLFSATAAKKASKVYSFEPDPDIIAKYLSITAAHAPNIEIENFAVGSRVGTARFARNIENIGAGKIVKQDAAETFDVNITTLDDFVEKNGLTRVDYIKADIEGAERDMLAGASNVLKKFAPKLSICTYHLPDDKEVLENLVRSANSDYIIKHEYKKMYAYVPEEKRS